MRQFSLILILTAIVAFNGAALATPLSAEIPAGPKTSAVNFKPLTLFKDSYLATINEAGLFNFELKTPDGQRQTKSRKSRIAVNFNFKNTTLRKTIRRKRTREKIYIANLFGFSDFGYMIFDASFVGRKIISINSFSEPPKMKTMNFNSMICQKVS